MPTAHLGLSVDLFRRNRMDDEEGHLARVVSSEGHFSTGKDDSSTVGLRALDLHVKSVIVASTLEVVGVVLRVVFYCVALTLEVFPRLFHRVLFDLPTQLLCQKESLTLGLNDFKDVLGLLVGIGAGRRR